MNKWSNEEDLLLINNYQLRKKDLLLLFPNRTSSSINIRASKLGLRKKRNEHIQSKLDILLLDEPLSNLDAKLREKMRRDIRTIQQEFKLTMVYVTHDQREAFQMTDKVLVMNKGKIEQMGTPDDIQKNPKTEFGAEFIKSGE